MMEALKKDMTCEEFHSHMAELIGAGEDLSGHRHVQNCDLCRALLKDLEAIAEAARQLFPVEDPPDRLWEQIESAIKQEEPSRK
jgi:predicted anti-sigma-YlaC factor YlaD